MNVASGSGVDVCADEAFVHLVQQRVHVLTCGDELAVAAADQCTLAAARGMKVVAVVKLLY